MGEFARSPRMPTTCRAFDLSGATTWANRRAGVLGEASFLEDSHQFSFGIPGVKTRSVNC